MRKRQVVLLEEHGQGEDVTYVPLRRQLREAVETARAANPSLSWAVLADRVGIGSRTALRKMLQGEAPIDDATAARIAAAVDYEVVLRRR